jgi:hypothetical protein
VKNTIRTALATAALSLLAGSAAAQHAKFVLFTDPDPAFAEAPKDNTVVHPCTSPYFNENSFITTDLRFWYAYQKFDDNTPLGKGHGAVAACEVRLALTDRLQLVAYKDGYLWIDSDNLDESGWNDVAAGLKWNFYRDVPEQFYMAVGAGYQFPWGDADVLQNDSEARVWFSIDKGWDKFHVGATLNGLFATDSDERWGQSDRIHWNVHLDYRLTDWFSPVVEFNGNHSLNDEDATLPFQGGDLGNFGKGEDDTIITAAVGGELRPFEGVAFRAMYEDQLNHEDDLFDWRVTLSLVISF